MFEKSAHQFQAFLVRKDPGLSKLLAALRGTLAVAVSYFLLSTLSRALTLSPLLAFIGVLIALMSSLLVSDATIREQKTTFLYIAISSSIALLCGVFLSQWPLLQLIFFIASAYVAIFLRRYGMRGLAVGMLIFMAYFCTLFFPLTFHEVHWSMAAIWFASAISFSVRFHLLPDHPRVQLRLARLSFRLQLVRTLEKLAESLEKPKAHENLLEDLRPDLRLINQLSFEGETRIKSIDTQLSPEEIDHYQSQLFEVELSVRKAIEAAWTFSGRPEILSLHLSWLASELREIAQTPWDRPLPPGNKMPASFPRTDAFLKVQTALDEVRSSWKFSYFTPSLESKTVVLEEKPVSLPLATTDPENESRIHPNTIAALQVTLATGLAAWGGTLISKDRWYWAAITAFVLFTGAARGETVTRAVLRVIGTVLGLVFGFLLVYSIAGHRNAEGVLIFICVFLGIYLARAAYGFWTAAFFTLLLAIFYDFLGQMTVDVLILRLNETLVGAVVSGLVSFFVFPISTKETVRQALSKLLEAATLVLEELPQKSASPFARRELIRRLRSVDQELYNLRTAAGPLQGRLIFAKGNEIANLVHETSLFTHYIRKIGTSIAGQLSLEQTNQISSLKEQIKFFADELKRKSSRPDDNGNFEFLPVVTATQDSELAHWSERIIQILASLKRRTK